jgi:ribonuclease HI
MKSLRLKFSKKYKKFKRELVNKAKKRREKNYALNQKRTIANVLEEKLEWDGPHIVRVNNKVITEPKEVKKIIRKTFKAKMTPDPQAIPRPEPPDGFHDIYEPDDSIDSEVWADLFEPISTDEVIESIKALPLGKSPGNNGITYEILKILFSEDNKHNLNALTRILNLSMQTGLFPTKGSHGIIALLPKIHNWSGQLDKTRPITLLEVHRKLFESILNSRMAKIIYSNNLLKGVNFGFRAGAGTTEAICMIKHLIDLANARKVPIYAAILDVEAAYDKVPHDAIYAGLSRIHAPPHLIDLLKNMEATRVLQVDTPFGLTRQFRPILGLAQGSLLAPLLWNIFYDPLLLILQKQTVGFKINNTSPLTITAVAYADDLHPFAASIEELQKQLNLINDFLAMHRMKMNVGKTHVLTNLPSDHQLHPAVGQITLGGVPIPSIKPNHDLSRILGVHLSMDGKSEKTVNHAISSLKNKVAQINMKHIPSQVGINIINSVLMSKLLFRLQVSTLLQKQIDDIDITLRKLTKRKAGLPLNTPNDILYDPAFGLNLQEFKDLHASQLITNTIAMQRSETIMGDFLGQVDIFYKNHLNMPLSLLAAPIQASANKKNNLFRLISSTLLNENMQIRPLNYVSENGIAAQALSHQQYTENLHTFIRPLTCKPLESFKLPSNRSVTYSFNNYIPTLLRRQQSRLTQYYDYAPRWFSEIICALAKVPYRPLQIHESLQIPQMDNAPPFTFSGYQELEAFTDGSFKNGKMGSASIIRGDNQLEISLQSRPSINHASGGKAEKHALLQVLQECESTITLNVKTDSQGTLKAIKDISLAQSQRDVIKIEDYPLVEKIYFELQRFHTAPSIQWVKAHADNLHNNKADELSKLARENPELPLSTIRSHKTGTSLERDLHIFNTMLPAPERIDCYPRTYFKEKKQSALASENTDRIMRHWVADFPQLDVDYNATTTALSIVLSRSNNLDASNHRVHAFRINCLNRSLQTLELLNSYNFWLREGDQCVICERHAETRDHIWNCPRVNTGFLSLALNTSMYAHAEIKAYCESKNLNLNEFTKDCIHAVIDYFFFDQDPDQFLASPAARGIITKKEIKATMIYVDSLVQDSPLDKFHYKSSPWLLSIITASWTRSLYDFYWQPRTQQIFKENELSNKQAELDTQREKTRRRYQKKRAQLERRRAGLQLLMNARREKATNRPRTPTPPPSPTPTHTHHPKNQRTPGRASRQSRKKRQNTQISPKQPTTPTRSRNSTFTPSSIIPTTRSGAQLKNIRSPRKVSSPKNRKKPKLLPPATTATSVQARILAELGRNTILSNTMELEDNPFYDNYPKKPPIKRGT